MPKSVWLNMSHIYAQLRCSKVATPELKVDYVEENCRRYCSITVVELELADNIFKK